MSKCPQRTTETGAEKPLYITPMTVESGGVFCLGKESLPDRIIFALLLHDLLGRQTELSYNVDECRQCSPFFFQERVLAKDAALNNISRRKITRKQFKVICKYL